jgi:hypothetical protein
MYNCEQRLQSSVNSRGRKIPWYMYLQQPFNNHTTTIIHYNIITTKSTKPSTHKTPRTPSGAAPDRRCHPSSPHCATARRGRPVAYPKGRPHPRRTPRAAPAPPLAILRHGAARAAGGLPERPPPPMQDPKGGAGATPRHPALRRGEGGRWPTRRAAPYPQDPKGCAGATLHHPALRRGEGARRPLPEGPPPPPTSDPAPPEIGRGSKRALTHHAGSSLTGLM